MEILGGKKAAFWVLIVCIVANTQYLTCRGIDFKKIEHLSLQHGLSQSTIICVIQDRNGFLWFGTIDGLNRYDGYEFKTFYEDPEDKNSLSDSGITCLLEDKKGYIWVGTAAGGLNKFDPSTETFTRYNADPDDPTSLLSDYIRAIDEDEDGRLWVGAATYLHKFDPATGVFKPFRFHLPTTDAASRQEIKAVFATKSGTVLVGGYHIGMGVFDVETETFEYFHKDQDPPTGLTSNNIRFFFPVSDHEVWLGTVGGGLLSFDPGTKRFEAVCPQSVIHSNHSLLYLFDGCRSTTRPEIFWFTTSKGLVEFDSRQGCKLDLWLAGEGNNLNNNDLVGVLEDREGNLWVGGYGAGLNKYAPSKSLFKEWRKVKGATQNLNNNIVFSVLEDKNGKLWFGSMGGGIECYDKETGEFTVYRNRLEDKEGLWSDLIRTIYQDRRGDLWIGTNGSGLIRLDPGTGKSERFSYESGNPKSLSGYIVNCIHEDRNGVLWIGTWSNGLCTLDRDSGTFHRYYRSNGQASELDIQSVKVIHEDSDGKLWIGTWDDGLHCVDEARKECAHYKRDITDPFGLNCNTIIDIYESQDGILWLGTNGGGLNRFDKSTGRFEHVTVVDGLPNNIVYGVLEDAQHHLWLSTNKGLARFDYKSREIEVFTMADGLPSNEFNTRARFLSPSGEMYFGTTQGLVSFFPEDIRKSMFKPPVVFTAFKLLNRNIKLKQSITHLKELTLSYKDTFMFEFAALSYSSPSKNQYAYKLSGLQPEWVPLGHKRTLNFAHLEPGNYQLTVKGSNSDGVWNESGASIRLIIVPPVWQTWWFKLLVMVCIILLAYRWHSVKLRDATLKLKTESAMNRLFARFKLSEREQEIVDLILKGKANKDIEEELFISIKTVKSHIYNIYRKMGVKNRLELINLVQKSVKE